MPYRDAIESVLQRCDELREQIERIEESVVDVPEVHTVGQALAWETTLRTWLDHLEVRRRESDGMVSVLAGSGALPEPPSRPLRNVSVVAVALVAGALLIGVVAFVADHGAAAVPPPPRSDLRAGSVTSDAHRGDRCTVAIDDYDIDVICPTIERRFRVPGDPTEGPWVHATIPGQLDFDRRAGSLAMTDENERVLYIQLGAWR